MLLNGDKFYLSFTLSCLPYKPFEFEKKKKKDDVLVYIKS